MLHKLLTSTASLFLVSSNNQAGILSAEAERIAHCGVDFRLARGIRHIIQIAFRIGLCQVQGGRKNAFLDGLDAGDGFGQAAGAHEVAGRGLGGAHRRCAFAAAEHGLDRQRFGLVAERRGRAR